MYKTPADRIAVMSRPQLVDLWLDDMSLEETLLMLREYILLDEEGTSTEVLRDLLMEWHR